ncbi:hypothetical protein ACWDNT_12975 [Streptomyces sp. NPDC000963]
MARSGSSVASGDREGSALVADGALVGDAEVVTAGGGAGTVEAPELGEASADSEAEAEGEAVADADGEAEGDADVRRGVGEDDVGSGLPDEGDGSSDTAGFRDALVVTSGTAARSSVPPPPRAAAARAAVPATATAAAAAIATPRLRPRGRFPPGGGGTSPTPRRSSGIVSEGSPPSPGYGTGPAASPYG